MKRNRLFLFLALFFVSLLAVAGPRSLQQAQQIARLHAQQITRPYAGSRSTAFSLMSTDTELKKQSPAYFVFSNGEDRGITVVSADDRMPEIVAYTTDGDYDEAQLPDGFVYFLEAYQAFSRAVERGDARALRVLAEREAFKASGYQQPKVAPLLGDIQWNQLDPYNLLCPTYQGGKRSATGCVATAMAQVMRYHKHPAQLLKEIPGYEYTEYGGTQKHEIPSIPVSQGVYDWDNMKPNYNYLRPTTEEKNAVAKLMFHCGMAVQMQYGPQSGANVYPEKLAEYFGYDADLMQNLLRESFPIDQWSKILDHELSEGRPMLYGGQSTDGGHEFVCDGSDGSGLYHINWGWGGSQDGYFDITILNCEKGGVGSGNAPDGFNIYNDVIIGIQPDNGRKDEPYVQTSDVVVSYISPSELTITNGVRQNASETFTLEIKEQFVNRNKYNVKGDVAFGMRDAQGNIVLISDLKTVDLNENYANTFTFAITKAFAEGTFAIFPIYRRAGGAWMPCGYDVTASSSPYTMKVTDKTIERVTPLSATLKLQGTLYVGEDNKVSVEFVNESDHDYIDAVYVFQSESTTMPENSQDFVYLSVPAKGKVTREITVNPKAEKTYLSLVDDGCDLSIGDIRELNAVKREDAGVQDLVLVKAEANVTAGSYDTEKLHTSHQGTEYVLKTPKIEDDKVVFNISLRNDGATYTCQAGMVLYDFITKYALEQNIQPVTFEAGAVTAIPTMTFRSPNLKDKLVWCQLELYDINDVNNSNQLSFKTELEPQYLPTITNPDLRFRMQDGCWMYCVTGVGTGIDAPQKMQTLLVRGSRGTIDIRSEASLRIGIYRLNGQQVTEVDVEAGEPMSVPVAPGIYLVGNTKVVVR